MQGWRRYHRNRLPAIRDMLWESGVPVAWIVETGRRVTGIGERVLVCRWPGVAELGLLEGADTRPPLQHTEQPCGLYIAVDPLQSVDGAPCQGGRN